jgi:hypothetical protein
MPVKMTSAAPAEWPAHLKPPGTGEAKKKPWADTADRDLVRRAKARIRRRIALERTTRPTKRQLEIGRAMENILIEEAEEEARLRRWRRRQLEARGGVET